MKNTIKNVLIAAVVLSTVTVGFVSCKKGPNDPTLSLRSRKARISGTWTLKTGEGTNVDQSASPTVTENWTLDGGTYTSTTIVGPVTGSPVTSAYNQTLTVNKDGTWSASTSDVGTGYSDKLEETGIWNFTYGMGDRKNKSQALFRILTSSETYTDTVTTVTAMTYTGTDGPIALWDLDELRKKKMVVKWDGTTIGSVNVVPSQNTSSVGTYTYEK